MRSRMAVGRAVASHSGCAEPIGRRRLFLLFAALVAGSCGGAPFGRPPLWRRQTDHGEQPPRLPPSEVASPPPPPPQLQAGAARVKAFTGEYFGKVAVAGAVSCSVTHSVVVPLDVIKTAMQTDASLSSPLAAIKKLASGCKGTQCVSPFLNGLGATSIGYFLQGATKFGGYEFCKRQAVAKLREAGTVSEELIAKLQLPIMLASAACAETVASAALCPLEVLKLRMQTSPHLAGMGMQAAMLSILRKDGVGALFRGLGPIAMRQVPYTACKLVTFELISAALEAPLAERFAQMRSQGLEPPRTAIVLAAGLLAGAAAAVVSQPFDLLLTRMCGSSSLTKLTDCVVSNRLRDQLLYLVQLGPAAFTGLRPRLMMISVMTSCQFFLYDSLRTALDCAPP